MQKIDGGISGKTRLEKIDQDLLTPIVQKSLGESEIAVQDWDYEVVKGDWSASKRLVCRFFGRAASEGKEIPWSVFLKIPEPTHAQYSEWHREPFQREVLLFQSGILESLPGGIVVPRCLGITEFPDDEPWMWLEHLKGTPSMEWPLDRFGLMAHQFGLMQGALMDGEGLPDYPWLATAGSFRLRLLAGVKRASGVLENMKRHPLTEDLYRSKFGESLQRLWSERGRFFDVLERMPQTLCHGDFCYPNVFDCKSKTGQPVTGVIDWQYCGMRQIGSDLAGFIADSSVIPVRRKAAEPEVLSELMLEEYLRGIKDSGWKGGIRQVRFACLTYLALPWTFNLLPGLDSRVLTQEPTEENRNQLEELVEEYRNRQEFLLSVGDEARRLMEAGI